VGAIKYVKGKLKSLAFLLFISILIYIGFLLGSMTNQAQAASATVVGSVVNLRSGPGTHYLVAGSLYKDTRVEVTGSSGEWRQVKFGTLTGWVHSSLLEVAPPQMLKVGVEVANLRSGPGADYDIIGQVRLGDLLTLVGKEGDWYIAKTSDGKGAYIRQDMIAGQSAAASTSQASTPALKAEPSPNLKIVLNNQPMSFTVAPCIENNRIMVPLREVFDAVGATVGWNNARQTATVDWGAKKIVLPVDSFEPTVNGSIWRTDVPIRKYRQTTMAPLRFVIEALGGTASWDPDSSTVYVFIPPADGLKAVGVVVTSPQVNLRSGPGTFYEVVGKAGKGEQMSVIKQLDGWYQVNRAGQNAWVAGWIVEVVWGGTGA
jgi:N-acetylmuramoyl-L-alanine amidase